MNREQTEINRIHTACQVTVKAPNEPAQTMSPRGGSASERI
jgi:hypothetical protein